MTQFLIDIKPDFIKVPSSHITKLNLLNMIPTSIPVHLSTGMSDWTIVQKAFDILKKHDLILYHCTSSYPTEFHDLNLSIISEYQKRFPTCQHFGFSSHNDKLLPAIVARTLGATYFEYHITLDRSQDGTDHQFALDRQLLKLLKCSIDKTEIVMGSNLKQILASEQHAKRKLRDGIDFIK